MNGMSIVNFAQKLFEQDRLIGVLPAQLDQADPQKTLISAYSKELFLQSADVQREVHLAIQERRFIFYAFDDEAEGEVYQALIPDIADQAIEKLRNAARLNIDEMIGNPKMFAAAEKTDKTSRQIFEQQELVFKQIQVGKKTYISMSEDEFQELADSSRTLLIEIDQPKKQAKEVSHSEHDAAHEHSVAEGPAALTTRKIEVGPSHAPLSETALKMLAELTAEQAAQKAKHRKEELKKEDDLREEIQQKEIERGVEKKENEKQGVKSDLTKKRSRNEAQNVAPTLPSATNIRTQLDKIQKTKRQT